MYGMREGEGDVWYEGEGDVWYVGRGEGDEWYEGGMKVMCGMRDGEGMSGVWGGGGDE